MLKSCLYVISLIKKKLMHNSFLNNFYTYQTYILQIPYLKTEDARDCTKGAQVSIFSFSLPKWETKTYYGQTLSNI